MEKDLFFYEDHNNRFEAYLDFYNMIRINVCGHKTSLFYRLDDFENIKEIYEKCKDEIKKHLKDADDIEKLQFSYKS